MAVADPSGTVLATSVPVSTATLPDAGGTVVPVVNEDENIEKNPSEDSSDVGGDAVEGDGEGEDDGDSGDGFSDDGEVNPDTGFQDDLDDDDDLDEFDDIDEDDFDDNFDDDFEEEVDDDYEIEIDDEISTEFGLGSNANKEPEIEDGLDDFEDFENVE